MAKTKSKPTFGSQDEAQAYVDGLRNKANDAKKKKDKAANDVNSKRGGVPDLGAFGSADSDFRRAHGDYKRGLGWAQEQYPDVHPVVSGYQGGPTIYDMPYYQQGSNVMYSTPNSDDFWVYDKERYDKMFPPSPEAVVPPELGDENGPMYDEEGNIWNLDDLETEIGMNRGGYQMPSPKLMQSFRNAHVINPAQTLGAASLGLFAPYIMNKKVF